MRKTIALSFVLALGMVVMAGCGGDGTVVDTVPQSLADYEGPQQPAVLDTSTNTQNMGVNFMEELNHMSMMFGGGIRIVSLGTTSSSTSDFVEGGDGGSLTYSSSSSISWAETSLNTSLIQSLIFSDFADSGGVNIYYGEGPNGNDKIAFAGQGKKALAAAPGSFIYSNLQAGRGAAYRSITSDFTTDGIGEALSPLQSRAAVPRIPRPVGNMLTDNVIFYSNYDSFYTSQGYAVTGTYFQSWQRQFLQSGFASANNMAGPYDTTTMNMPFDDTLSADYAEDYFYSSESYYAPQETNQSTRALLGFNQTHAWDLSTATFNSSGTYCAEGDVMSVVLGCADFDVSITWDHDATTRGSCRYSEIFRCYGWPESGSITLGSDGASAAFAFTPTGGTFTFDAGDGSAPFETNIVPPSPD